ncbi:MFS transporter [Pseudorhodoferax sp.]|uniref:MFS transporter n=1 Tax=Pseudorhodoferax sp. TaxID=1993553 RepID=UPI002DD624EB|nr:MFS transporter [Pseudorhodoferax sp.]
MSEHETTGAPRAGRREWIGLAVLALPCMVYAMDLTVLNLALPALAAEFRPSAVQMLWIVDIYGFMVAGFLITMGTLGDRYGRRRLLMIGAAAFAAASVLAALARSADTLVAARALLGVAGATVAPSTMSLIRNMFHDATERQFAIGVWIAAFSAGSAIGPLVGGVLMQFFGWPSVFWAAVPVMALVLLLGPVLLPEYRDPDAGGIDLPSVALSLAAVLVATWGIKTLAEQGLAALPLLAVLAGVAIGVLFVRRQRTLPYPLLDLRLLADRRIRLAIAIYGLTGLAMAGTYLLMTQYLQLVLGLAPLQAGLAVLPWSLAFLAGALLAPRWARRWGVMPTLRTGLAMATLSFVLLLGTAGPWPLAVLVLATVMMGLGLSPVFTLGNEMIITAAPVQRAGSASALSETVIEFAAAVGIALGGSLATLIYRTRLTALLPEAPPAGALATLGGAVAEAAALPATAGQALVAAAQQSFTLAFHATCVVATAVGLVAMLLARRLARPGASKAIV